MGLRPCLAQATGGRADRHLRSEKKDVTQDREYEDKLDDLFFRAVNLPEDERGAFIERHCRHLPELRRELESMLTRPGDHTGGFLEHPAHADLPSFELDVSLAGQLPRKIGRYAILGLLGQGGMGTVYEARQEHPNRLVALKVVRGGVLSGERRRRFAREAQILGRFRHPGIAQIYEAGTTEGTGDPFFAMELVRGRPLSEYAREHEVDIARRLELVARVCDNGRPCPPQRRDPQGSQAGKHTRGRG